MQLEAKVKLPVNLAITAWFERFKQFTDIVFDKQRTAKNPYDLHNGAMQLHVMFQYADEAVCDDCNVYLDTDGVLGFTPKRFDLKVLLNPFEELMISFS